MKSRKWLVVFGGVALAILIMLNWGYRQALQALEAELDTQLSDRLLALAEDLSVQVDPETLTGNASVDEFVSLYEKVQEYRRTHGLADVRILDTGFVDLLGESPDSLSAAIVSRLDYPTFLTARSGFAAVSETYRWEDGYYKSAYAPILDSAGQVAAVVRVEADADFFAVVDVFEHGLWLSHVLSGVFVVAVGGLFFWFFRRQAAWERRLLLSQKLLAMGAMASVIAHEIRNPLGIIKATAQRLAKLEPEKQKPLLEFIPEEIDRLDAVLTGYLQFADIRVQQPQPVQVAKVIEAVVAGTESYRRKKEIGLEIHAVANLMVLADAEALGRALENLVCNAVDASPEKGCIDVECRAAGHTAHLTVADCGPGVPRSERKKIFEPFYTTRAQGSGLGLYAARTSVEKMGGKLSYHPRDGGGSVFHITLPIAKPTETPDGYDLDY